MSDSASGCTHWLMLWILASLVFFSHVWECCTRSRGLISRQINNKKNYVLSFLTTQCVSDAALRYTSIIHAIWFWTEDVGRICKDFISTNVFVQFVPPVNFASWNTPRETRFRRDRKLSGDLALRWHNFSLITVIEKL